MINLRGVKGNFFLEFWLIAFNMSTKCTKFSSQSLTISSSNFLSHLFSLVVVAIAKEKAESFFFLHHVLPVNWKIFFFTSRECVRFNWSMKIDANNAQSKFNYVLLCHIHVERSLMLFKFFFQSATEWL